MTWTYSIADLATSQRDQVRRLLGDVISTDQQIADEEIALALTLRPGVYGPAAECARFIAAQYSRKVDVVVATVGGGQMKTNYSQQAKYYFALATTLDYKASILGAAPYAGGISVSDKLTNVQDSDRVAPQFNLGMTDDLDNPVGPVGNQTPGAASSEGSG